jgi:pimeloyl-ACP methyl ester carboxylesterase
MAEQNEHVRLVEFPDIGHADLVECPEDAIRVVSEFFEEAAPEAVRTAARAGAAG